MSALSEASNAPAWTLVSAQPDDADALALIGAATFLETFAGVLDGAAIVAHCGVAHASGYYTERLKAGAAAWLAQVEHGAPIGYALLDKPQLPEVEVREDDLELKRIYALSRFQGGGLGRALMATAQDEARRRGAQRLLLGVYAQNQRALAFYARAGFVRLGQRRFSVGGREYEDMILALDLA